MQNRSRLFPPTVAVGGALAGWKRRPTDYGWIVDLQLAGSADDVERQRWTKVVVALDDQRLASLIRDLTRAAEARGLVVWPKGRP
jgi:hypothetical protein